MAPSTPRDRFVAWLRWYLRTHPTVVRTRAALARRLGLTRGAVTLMFRSGSKAVPFFGTIVAARELTGVPVDVMLFCEPPEPELRGMDGEG